MLVTVLGGTSCEEGLRASGLLGHKAISLLPAVSSGGEPEAAGCAPTAHGRTCENGTELPGEDQTVLWERLIDCESDQCREVS